MLSPFQCLKAWEDAIREIQAKEPVLETTKLDSIESSSLGDKESTETEKIESDGKWGYGRVIVEVIHSSC